MPFFLQIIKIIKSHFFRVQLGWLAHPIFSSNGDYPAIMIEQIAANSMQEKRSWSRLPVFSEKWIDIIRGSADFLALNYYTSFVVTRMSENSEAKNPSHYRDKGFKRSVKPEWKRGKSGWLYSVPSGLGDILKYILFAQMNISLCLVK